MRARFRITALALLAFASWAPIPDADAGPVRGEFAGRLKPDEGSRLRFDVYRTVEGERRVRLEVEDLLLHCDNGETSRVSIAKHVYGFQRPQEFGGADESTFFPFGQTSKLEIRGSLGPDRVGRGFIEYEVADDDQPDCSTGGAVVWRAKKRR
jgi:hypothetical protein